MSKELKNLAEYNAEASPAQWAIRCSSPKLKIQNQLNEASENLNISVVIESKSNGSVVDDTFKELDEKLSIINKETKDWLKQKILWYISEAYNRGKADK